MAKGKGGFIGQDGLNAPDAPTGVSGSAGGGQVSVSFTAPSDVGGSAITGYVATSNDGIGASGSSSPITVTGLTNGTSYTFNVWAINAFGYSAPSDASGSVTPNIDYTQRGLFAIGYYFGYKNTIDYVDLSSAGNTSDFGDLTVTGESGGAVASSTRAVFGGRYNGSLNNTIDYVTIASVGNATDFGDMNVSKRRYGACSSTTRGLFGVVMALQTPLNTSLLPVQGMALTLVI